MQGENQLGNTFKNEMTLSQILACCHPNSECKTLNSLSEAQDANANLYHDMKFPSQHVFLF